MPRPNVYEGEFQMNREDMGVRGRMVARPAGAKELGGTVYELAPGASGFNLHGHYGNEEMFIVLTGTLFERVPEGGDQGIVGLFRLEDNLRQAQS